MEREGKTEREREAGREPREKERGRERKGKGRRETDRERERCREGRERESERERAAWQENKVLERHPDGRLTILLPGRLVGRIVVCLASGWLVGEALGLLFVGLLAACQQISRAARLADCMPACSPSSETPCQLMWPPCRILQMSDNPRERERTQR